MAPAGTLWTSPTQASGKTVRNYFNYSSNNNIHPFNLVAQIKAAAALGGIEISFPDKYEHYVDNKKPEFLSKFPHGKIPTWEGADGFHLYEGVPIARYGESSLSII